MGMAQTIQDGIQTSFLFIDSTRQICLESAMRLFPLLRRYNLYPLEGKSRQQEEGYA